MENKKSFAFELGRLIGSTPLIGKVANLVTGSPKQISPSMLPEYDQYIPGRKKPTSTNLSTFIAPVTLQRIRQDVDTWREAVREAENAWYPQRVRMQQMFNDTIQNGHVFACYEKRKELTLLRQYHLVDALGNVNEKASEVINEQWFYDMVSSILDAKFYGYNLLRIGDIENRRPTTIDFVRRNNVSPDRMNVQPLMYSLSGIPFNDPNYENIDGQKPFDWHIFIPTPSENGTVSCGYGLLYKVAIYEIFCRNMMGFNADYVELFGQPLRHAKTSKTQEDPEYAQLESFLANMGSRGYVMTDLSDEIEFIQTTQGQGNKNPFENLEMRCEAKISKIILGHEDALESTPGKLGSGQGEGSPVLTAINEKQRVDGRWVAHLINNVCLPKLRNLGVDIPEGLTFAFSKDDEKHEQAERENQTNKEVAEIVSTLNTAGYEVDENYIIERTGIPLKKKEVQEPQPKDIPTGKEVNIAVVRNELREFYANT